MIEIESELNQPEVKESIQKISFISLGVGANFLGETDSDTGKNGNSISIKIGKEMIATDKKLKLSLGYMFNSSETKDSNNSKGVYQINSNFLEVEGSYLKRFSDKIALGPKIELIGGDDVNLSDGSTNDSVGLLLGGEVEYSLSKKYDLTLDIKQRVDKTNRVNMFINFSLKINW